MSIIHTFNKLSVDANLTKLLPSNGKTYHSAGVLDYFDSPQLSKVFLTIAVNLRFNRRAVEFE